MPRKWMVLIFAALIPVLALAPSGCVLPGDVGVALLVSPESLDFGTTSQRLTVQVSKIFSSNKLQPVVAIASEPWIVVEDCNDAADQCLSNGPGQVIPVRISVRREQMTFGTNRGSVVFQSSGASVKTLEVLAQDTLQASFTADRRAPQAGQPVQFTDLSLADDDILSRTWDFGDGTTSTDINPVHIYSKDGTYSVSLTVRTKTTQETSTSTGYINVATAVANVDFKADRTSIVVNDLVYFTDLTVSPTSPILSYAWDFGDTGNSNLPNPNHQYREAGPKTVTLTVTTAQGTVSQTKTNYILVGNKQGPTAKIAISQLKPYVDIPVQLSDVSDPGSAPTLSRVWQFGDGISSTETNPLHRYRQVGSYTVKLTEITDHGQDSVELPIEVIFKPPHADFTVQDLDSDPTTTGTNPDTFQFIQFVDLSEAGSAAVNEWHWDFGDGKTSTEKNPQHRYTVAKTYTVSLTVKTPLPSSNEDTETKKDYIVVVSAPAPAFSYAPTSIFTDQTVKFTNQTLPGSEPITSYFWDFDGNPATTNDQSGVASPSFAFRTAGKYNATLTVNTALRSRKTVQLIIVDKAPVADFTATPRTSSTVDAVAFTDTTKAGVDGASTAKGIVGRTWDFGDGTSSTGTNPSHLYTTAGIYTPRLVVTYAHSGTGQTFTTTVAKTDYITVNNPTPPTASFSLLANPETGNPALCRFVGDTYSFSDASSDGTRPITSWLWQFGDGATSSARNPSHAYSTAGNFNVSLTVTSSALPAGFNSTTYTQELNVANVQELDAFVNTEDPAYKYNIVGAFPVMFGTTQIATAYNLYMVSQTWRTAADIYTGNFDGTVWNHNVTVVEPLQRTNDTGLLLVSGGNRTDAPPTESDIEDLQLGIISALTGSVLTVVSNVPAQPIEFKDEVVGGVALPRTEDQILAYSFKKYLDSYNGGAPDNTWPALFPMTKATVRTMDTVDTFLPSIGRSPLNDYIVLGGSKRGWTTWLTGITDCRVKAIAPIVIDLLNIDKTVPRQLQVYGDFSPSLGDYVALGVFQRFVPGPDGQPPADGQALLNLVDPYEYRDRVRIPKLLINATGDEFFLPDSSLFYFDDLKGESRLSYLPNTRHGLTEQQPDLSDPGNVASVFMSWAMSVIQDVPRPTVDWTFPNANTINVKLQTPIVAGTTVTLWQATNATGRDFRVDTIGTAYTSTPLSGDADGNYVATVSAPPSGGYRAYYVQVQIPSSAQPALSVPGAPEPTFVFSTPIRVTPDTYPFE